MTKAELIAALAGVADDSVVYIWSDPVAGLDDDRELIKIARASITEDDSTPTQCSPEFVVLEATA